MDLASLISSVRTCRSPPSACVRGWLAFKNDPIPMAVSLTPRHDHPVRPPRASTSPASSQTPCLHRPGLRCDTPAPQHDPVSPRVWRGASQRALQASEWRRLQTSALESRTGPRACERFWPRCRADPEAKTLAGSSGPASANRSRRA